MNKNTFTLVTSILKGSLFGFALVLGVAFSLNAPSAHAQTVCDPNQTYYVGDGTGCDTGGDPGGGDPPATPSVGMTATPSSMQSGYSSSLSYSSANVTACTINNGVGTVTANTSGARTVTPTTTTTYTITCDSASGQVTAQATVTVTAAPQPVSAYCSAGPDTAQINEAIQWSSFPSTGSSNLTWKQGATFVTKTCTGGQNYTSTNTCEDISNGDACTVEGAKCRQSAECDTYTDPSGQTNAHTTYGAVTPFTCTANSGSTNTFSWSGTDGLSGTTQNVSKAYATTGTKSGQVTITASTGGSAVATCTANVVGITPTATLTASPSSVSQGNSSTLTWGSTNASSCSLNESIGTVATSGTRSVSPSSTTTYTLICSAPGSTTNGTWQYYGDDYTDYACPLTEPNKAYSALPDCPANPAGTSCTGNGMCKINTVASNPACTIYSELYECRGSATAPSQSVTATATVTVTAPAAVSCAASRTSVAPGESVTYTASPSGGAGAPYSWTSTSGSGGYGTAATATRTFTNQGDYDMRVGATGVVGTTNCPLVSVSACPGARTVNIDATPTRVRVGGTVTLNWQASGINTSCTITGPTGTLSTTSATSCTVPNGTITTSVTNQSTYTISCDSGAITDSVIVNVVPNFEEF